MAVPTSITDLDSTIANNSPAGSDAIGTTLDDYLRSHAGIIRATTNKNTTINRVQLGENATATNNFTITAEAADGTMKLARGNAGSTTQDVLTVDGSGNVNAPVGLKKAGSVVQALSDFSGSNVSLTQNGYQKLPGGLIIQWGRVNVTGSQAITFPTAFPAAVQVVITNGAQATGTAYATVADGQSTTGFNLICFKTADGSNATAVCSWLAIGY